MQASFNTPTQYKIRGLLEFDYAHLWEYVFIVEV